MTAVLILIFKDTILSFIASLQLTYNNMIRKGDWITMPKFNADGDVIDIALHTVKIQNFDKTITTIPTHKLIADSFVNWRGMSESGGRRIKRSLMIDITSVKFLTPKQTKRFKNVKLLKDYMTEREKDINDSNNEKNIEMDEVINGRRMTNLGTFREYIKQYLLNNSIIHTEMTRLVRQLAPTDKGLPIEIYAFTNDNDWLKYEAAQADIFDHLFAIAPEFDLKIFQSPTGSDFSNLSN